MVMVPWWARQDNDGGPVEMSPAPPLDDVPYEDKAAGAFVHNGVRWTSIPVLALKMGWVEMAEALREDKGCPARCPGDLCFAPACPLARMAHGIRKRRLARRFNTLLSGGGR